MPSKASILGALSRALDMVEGQPEGHALRTCLIAMRVGKVIGLSEAELAELYFASLLKDAGCSNNAVRIQKIFGGDDILSKRNVKFVDWSSPFESVKFAIGNTERGNSLGTKLRRMIANIGPPSKVMSDVTEARCTRGAQIARMLGFGEGTALAIQNLDEHWDGRGAPRGMKGETISVLARILCTVQTFEVFLTAFGLNAAYDMLEKRVGRWFDPQIVDVFRRMRSDDDFWEDHAQQAYEKVVYMELPAAAAEALDADIDQICSAFAIIVDAKSSFTSEHSVRVTEYAVALAEWFGFDRERTKTLRRAALLHDIGKLGISSGILEKPGRLTEAEFAQIKLHPKYSYEILVGVPGFGRIADLASAHHERLDGHGYWRGLSADDLDLDMRIITVADVFDALSARRPYREALPLEEVFAIMDGEAGNAFDPECLIGIKRMVQQTTTIAA